MSKFVQLTQGHLEDYQEKLRELTAPIRESWDREIVLEAPASLDRTVVLQSPTKHAFAFYLAFLALVKERTDNGQKRLAADEQRGLMIRAAIQTKWIKDCPWKLEDVRTLPSKLATWLGKRLDEVYSDFDFAFDEARVKAAVEAGWFVNLDEAPEDPQAIEEHSRLVDQAYRKATELDPE